MKPNVGNIDRVIRIVFGLGVIGAGLYYKSWFGLIGIVPLLTALVSFCPLYTVLGISSCPLKKEQ